MSILSFEPEVKLLRCFEDPYSFSVAGARTCYSPRVVGSKEVTDVQKDRIGGGCLKGGHHTVFQHLQFSFGLTNVSRQLTQTMLHTHPFYNSSESSQRYVKLDEVKSLIPPIEGEARVLFEDTVEEAWGVYNKLSTILLKKIIEIETERGIHIDDKKIKSLEKKAIEIARYAIPLSALTSMIHTINGITLYRMYRLMNQYPTGWEARKVILGMVEEVKKVDPDFFKHIDDPIPLKETLEYQFLKSFGVGSSRSLKEFDNDLGEFSSKLVDYTPKGMHVMADSIRNIMGKTREQLTDGEAVDFVLNPEKNKYLSETLNLSTMSPLMRTMHHPYFVFKKKISHTADCQNKRHRMTPASRPLIIFSDTREPDYIIPKLIEISPEALEIYKDWMDKVWRVKNKLIDLGVSIEFAQYILPNAVCIRMVESASLLNFWHKCKLRLCLNSQREIWKCAVEEIEQVAKVQPELVKYFGPNCVLRKCAGIKPFCPEGPRWCTYTSWETGDWKNKDRVL